MTIRLVGKRFFSGRRDWARRIESRQAATVSSAVGSAASRPSWSRSSVRSRTCENATSLSSDGFSLATHWKR